MNHALLIHFCTTSFLFSGPNRACPLCILSSARDGARFGSRVHGVLALLPWSDSVQHIDSPSFEHNFIPMTVLPSFSVSDVYYIDPWQAGGPRVPASRSWLVSLISLPLYPIHLQEFSFRAVCFLFSVSVYFLVVSPLVAICAHSVFLVLRPQDSQRCMCIHRK
jgi:hypothetical protein